MNGWQPIETAPKDGTAIWLLIGADPFIGHADVSFLGAQYWIAKASFERQDGKPDRIFSTCIADVLPTHWMPLPSPPKPLVNRTSRNRR